MNENSNQSSSVLVGSQAPLAPRTRGILRGKIIRIGSLRPGQNGQLYFQVDFIMEDGRQTYTYVVPTDDNYVLYWERLEITAASTKCIGMWLDGLFYENEAEGLINADSKISFCAPPPPREFEDEATRTEIEGLTAKQAEPILDFDNIPPGSVYRACFSGCEPPKELWRNHRYGKVTFRDERGKPQTGVLHLCGVGDRQAPVMFVGPCTLNEDYRVTYSNNPRMLKGAPGNLFQRSLGRRGFQQRDWYYTTLVKYNVPRLKIRPVDIRWSEAVLIDEIETIKPKIIVCMGKDVFDYLWQAANGGKARKFALKDVQGGFFECPKWNCVLYPMDTIMTPLMKPEYLERFDTDLQQVRQTLDEIQGQSRIQKVEQHYVVIENVGILVNVLIQIIARKISVLGVDCEWHGQTWVDGQLRSFQFSWQPGYAAFLKLMNQDRKYCFNQPLEVVQGLLRPLFGNPQVKFVGHNASADMPWMKYHLGIDVYRRFVFDTMYAQHTANEYADLKLERCAVKYTDLGRYDIPLCLWKKDNQFDEDNEPGYGRVPDRIIEPYGLKDVDGTLRLVEPLTKRLVGDGLLEYYNTFVLPFVTDGFFEMMDCGLPINSEYLIEMRQVFLRNQELLLQQFQTAVFNEAKLKLALALKNVNPEEGNRLFGDIMIAVGRNTNAKGEVNLQCSEFLDLEERIKEIADLKYMDWVMPFFHHLLEARKFNINSTEQLKRWLFRIKGLEPLKTTKKDGFQISWSKVMAIQDDAKRRSYQPAADKQTIKVYAEKDPLVAQVQELKSVANIVKAFLQEKDEEGKEQGIPKWIQTDGKIHANFALTETARPRAWKPNILNWPKAVTKPIEAAFERIQKAYPEHAEKPSCLRSVVEAPPGWCIIDMDLKTAEVVALAYQAGDEAMIRVLTEPDLQFARIDREDPKKVGRIAYNENSCYPEAEQDRSLIISTDDPRILRNDSGGIIHPKRDLHWEMAEAVASKPRERLDERLYRDGCGKVGNFSIPYGASAPLLERLIEVNTGIKPKEGTGAVMIDTWASRYPDAAKFQQEMADLIIEPGRWRSLSGRLRHFYACELSEIEDVEDSTRQKVMPPLERQARNFPCQELVAATTGKALLMFIEKRREMGLQSRIGILLYDAIAAFSPLEQAKVTAELLKNCLTTWIPWTVKGRTFNFEVDVSFGFRWGVKPTKEEKKLLAKYV